MDNTTINTMIKELRVLEMAATDLNKQADEIKSRLKAELDERRVDSIDTGKHKVFYTAYEKSSVDSAKLKKEGLYDKFLKTSTILQFRITDVKATI